jgi:hypothetical protein
MLEPKTAAPATTAKLRTNNRLDIADLRVCLSCSSAIFNFSLRAFSRSSNLSIVFSFVVLIHFAGAAGGGGV